MTLVMKFGGTSVGNAAAIRQTAALIKSCQQEWGQVVVVASAMGSKPVKVTDWLLTGATAAAAGDSETVKQAAAYLRQVHYEAIDELLHPERERQTILAENQRFINHYVALCEAAEVLGEMTPRALDVIGGMGEQMAIRILAAYLRQEGQPAAAVDATELIVTDNHFQAATPLMGLTSPKTEARLRPLLTKNIIPIVTGFIGATEDGISTTLGRGGSDYSGAILGQALQAKEVWIWTDVDGVMTADPRLVSTAQSIPTLSYREVSELAYFGAQVLHPKTMRPCVENGIPLRIKNTFHPDHPGTVIVTNGVNGRGSIKAVTAIKELAMITVEGRGMMGVPGIAARTFGAVAQIGVSVLLIAQASSEQSICFVTPAKSAPAVVESLERALHEELTRRDIDRVWARPDLSIVTVVGAGMQGTPGIAGRIFTALGEHHVNVIAIAQGSSECSISLVVQTDDVAAAVQHIHRLIV
ncbi:MAG: aspartate kinase [Anaerolineae bacterium]|nr:aspartate kinase [Anaerolineae bacterium]